MKSAFLTMPDGSRRTVGYTEATRGCKHLCGHCPIVPVYNGRFMIVQREVVIKETTTLYDGSRLAEIRELELARFGQFLRSGLLLLTMGFRTH